MIKYHVFCNTGCYIVMLYMTKDSYCDENGEELNIIETGKEPTCWNGLLILRGSLLPQLQCGNK